jgi:hypothetical protein
MKLSHKAPRVDLIEKIAAEFAGVWYETGRAQGMTSKYKTAKAFARANIERFVPNAVNHLLDMLNSPDYNDHVKKEIYVALMERIHDPDTAMLMEGVLPTIDISKVLDCKPEPPIVVNTKRFDPKIDTKPKMDLHK